MNIVQLQEQLKNFSQDQLIREMQMPSGNAPQFLVLGEIMRRQKMQQDFAARQAKGDQGTVAQEAVAAAGVPQGGIADMARALAPQTDMAGNTGVQVMAKGGPVKKMAEGDIVVRGGKRYIEQADGSYAPEEGDSRTWAQRNIGDPLRGFFQPIGEAAREVGKPIGEAAREFAQPIGDSVAFDLGPIPARPPAAPPALDPRAQFEPEGVGLGLEFLPPEVDPEYYARRTAAARPLIEALSPEEAAAEIERMRVAAEIPPTPEVPVSSADAMEAAAKASAEETAAARDAAGITESLRTPEDVAASIAAAKEIAAQQTAAAATATPPATPPAAAPVAPPMGGVASVGGGTSGGSAGGSGGGGGIAGVGGMSSYEQELMDMLGRREKAAEQDKWLALAQVGLNMMSSTQPTLLGAVGEAGLKGVEAARTARDQYDKDRLELLGAIEQSRMARAAAAARAARGAGGNTKPINATMIGNIEDQLTAVNEQIAMLRPPSEPSWWSGTIEDPDRAAREQLENRAAMLESVLSQAYATHGLPYLPTGIDPNTYANLSD